MPTDTARKARSQRLERLRAMLDTRLEQPAAALETLLSELKLGEAQAELWEGLHAASLRDQKEQELAGAYRKITTPQRLKLHALLEQAEILMHSADFHQGVLGDSAAAHQLLGQVLDIVPAHREAFARLEHKFSAAADKRELIELYARVADAPPKPAEELGRTVLQAMMHLPSGSVLSEEACKRLVLFAPHCLSILGGLESHCRKTGRPELAGTLIDLALEKLELPVLEETDFRRRAIELYEAANVRGKSIGHVEWLLQVDPTDARARAVADRLLTHREVGPRATAALRQARKAPPKAE